MLLILILESTFPSNSSILFSLIILSGGTKILSPLNKVLEKWIVYFYISGKDTGLYFTCVWLIIYYKILSFRLYKARSSWVLQYYSWIELEGTLQLISILKIFDKRERQITKSKLFFIITNIIKFKLKIIRTDNKSKMLLRCHSNFSRKYISLRAWLAVRRLLGS